MRQAENPYRSFTIRSHSSCNVKSMKTMAALFLIISFSLGAQSHPVEDFLNSLGDTPELKEFQWTQKAESLSGEARSMGMDLRLGYEIMAPENPEMRTHRIQLRQEFIGILTNPLERELGDLRARMTALDRENMEREIRLMAKMALAEWVATAARKDYLREAKQLLEQVKALAQVKFSTGTLDLPGWNRLADELDEMELELLMAEAESVELTGVLARLSPTASGVRTWPPYRTGRTGLLPDRDAFLEKALTEWPRLALARTQKIMLEKESTAAVGASFPNIMVMVGLTVPEKAPEQTSLTLGVEISLPTLGLPARAAMAEEANLRQKGTEESYRQREWDLDAAYRALTGRLSYLDRMVQKTEDDRIPRLKQTFRTLLEGYRVGRADFDELLETSLALTALQREVIDRRLEGEKLLLNLETFTGQNYLEFIPLGEERK